MSDKIPISIDVRPGRKNLIYRAKFRASMEVRGDEAEAEACAMRAANELSTKFFADIRNEGIRIESIARRIQSGDTTGGLEDLRKLGYCLRTYNSDYALQDITIEAND